MSNNKQMLFVVFVMLRFHRFPNHVLYLLGEIASIVGQPGLCCSHVPHDVWGTLTWARKKDTVVWVVLNYILHCWHVFWVVSFWLKTVLLKVTKLSGKIVWPYISMVHTCQSILPQALAEREAQLEAAVLEQPEVWELLNEDMASQARPVIRTSF